MFSRITRVENLFTIYNNAFQLQYLLLCHPLTPSISKNNNRQNCMNVHLGIKQINIQSLFYIVSNTVRPKASKKAFNIIWCRAVLWLGVIKTSNCCDGKIISHWLWFFNFTCKLKVIRNSFSNIPCQHMNEMSFY